MNKQENEPIEDDFLGKGIEEEINEDDIDVPNCEVFDVICSLFNVPKPFGLAWDNDKMIEFLRARGYKIIERTEDGETFKVAVRPGDTVIPDKPGGILKTFNNEIQDIILKWLLKIGIGE